MSTRQIVIYILVIVAAIVCIGFAGLYTFTKSAYDERSCDFANIDNIEMHAMIDIPATLDCTCEYLSSENTKRARFELDKNSMEMDEYIRNNQFFKVSDYSAIAFKDFRKFKKEAVLFTDNERLYLRKGHGNDADYSMMLDSKSAVLWVVLKYRR